MQTANHNTRQWHIAQYHAEQAIVGNIFMIGACGIIVVMFANYFGRLPVAIVWQCIALGTAAWSAAATSFPSYMAARIVNGFFCSVGQGGALMWIKDVSLERCDTLAALLTRGG